jgi:hypothetical protein
VSHRGVKGRSLNQDKTTWRRVVAGLILTLFAAPAAMGAGLVVYCGLRGRSYWDLGFPTYEHQKIAQAAGLGVLVTLTLISLVLIHNVLESRALIIFGVIWMLAWMFIFLLGTVLAM